MGILKGLGRHGSCVGARLGLALPASCSTAPPAPTTTPGSPGPQPPVAAFGRSGCTAPSATSTRHRRDPAHLRHRDPAGQGDLRAVRGPPRLGLPGLRRDLPRDTYQLIRAGLAGGKGVPDSVAVHPCVFATFTAPSFGPVHTRRVLTRRPGRPLPTPPPACKGCGCDYGTCDGPAHVRLGVPREGP